jgi:hypothetical protein
MMTSLGGKVPRPMGLKVKLGRLLVSEEAVRAGVSVTGTSQSTVVSLKEPQHEPQRILMDILRISGGEMSASDLCSKLYQQSSVARDHVREEYGSFKAFLTTTALKDEVDFVHDHGCGKVVLKTPQKAAAKAATAVPAGPEGSSDGAGSVRQKVLKFDEFQVGLSLFTANLPSAKAPAAVKRVAAPQALPPPAAAAKPGKKNKNKGQGTAAGAAAAVALDEAPPTAGGKEVPRTACGKDVPKGERLRKQARSL